MITGIERTVVLYALDIVSSPEEITKCSVDSYGDRSSRLDNQRTGQWIASDKIIEGRSDEGQRELLALGCHREEVSALSFGERLICKLSK